MVTLPLLSHRTEPVVFSPKRASSGTCRVPKCETDLAELQSPYSSCSLPGREGPENITLSKGMVGLRALDHVARPPGARGYVQHPHARSLPFSLSFIRSLSWQLLPCLLGCPSPAPSGAVLRSSGTFGFFSVLLCLAARTCLLLGVFLPCHLGPLGSFLLFLRQGLPESLRIPFCSLQSS